MPEMSITVETDESRQISAESIIYALFGMSSEDLVSEIRENKDSTYDGIIVSNIKAVV